MQGLPRASGDRPALRHCSPRTRRSAPRERGSTPWKPGELRLPYVCPARAGIDPSRSAVTRTARSLPRASGDRPLQAAANRVAPGSAPRERGSTLAGLPGHLAEPVCPARAGIDPTAWPASGRRCRLPRASGDRPIGRGITADLERSAPRERGSTPGLLRARLGHLVCPARAGIDPCPRATSRACARLPRASGDRPCRGNWRPTERTSAPRERGSTRLAGIQQRLDVVCPARAGIDPADGPG